MDFIDAILGDIHYESNGLSARVVVQHDIYDIRNRQGTGMLEVVVEGSGTSGKLEYTGAIAAFESPAPQKTMSTGTLHANPRPITPPIIPAPVLTIYFSEANLPAEPAKPAATCLAARQVYDEALTRLKALPLVVVEISFTDSLTTAIRDAQLARAAEAERAARSYINANRRPGHDYKPT